MSCFVVYTLFIYKVAPPVLVIVNTLEEVKPIISSQNPKIQDSLNKQEFGEPLQWLYRQ